MLNLFQHLENDLEAEIQDSTKLNEFSLTDMSFVCECFKKCLSKIAF